MMQDYLTIKEVANKYRISDRQVLYAIRRGHIQATKLGWLWVIDKATLPAKWPVRLKNTRTER